MEWCGGKLKNGRAIRSSFCAATHICETFRVPTTKFKRDNNWFHGRHSWAHQNRREFCNQSMTSLPSSVHAKNRSHALAADVSCSCLKAIFGFTGRRWDGTCQCRSVRIAMAMFGHLVRVHPLASEFATWLASSALVNQPLMPERCEIVEAARCHGLPRICLHPNTGRFAYSALASRRIGNVGIGVFS